MKIYTFENQKYISQKYRLSDYIPDKIKDFVVREIKVPAINEIVGTIYCFVNMLNEKVYVGQTYKKYYERFGHHYCDTFGKKDNLYFHNAIRKYGWSNFNKYIIWQSSECYEKNTDNVKMLVEILNTKESEFIAYFNSNSHEFGYNCTSGWKSTTFNTYIKTKLKVAPREKKQYHPLIYGDHPMAKPVLQFDLDGQFLNRWECVKLAEDNTGISIHPKAMSSGNCIWIWESEYSDELLQKKVDWLQENHKSIEKIYQYNFELELVGIYDSFADVERQTGFPKESICHATLEQRVGNDYLWLKESQLENEQMILHNILNQSRKYIAFHKPIYQIYLNGDIIKLWNSAAEIYQEYPNSKASINKCLNNRLNFFNNCLWIYEDELSDNLIEQKIEASKSRHRSLVEDIISGKIKYDRNFYLTTKHNTSNR